ncbi:unnamed protein product (macronuclear) [Paramecium tetraurelia]|uniref:Uncharacterized protein n=1 Tax=Paramecium tetraurelia TaxID=5888 RepID=A0DQN1_PARTE|nr:uncharacterized protein GSPATT00002748001 [Paramecium tetraurelia]CAK85348.1 unnamed protein product [Paramecium tetraurelia]|eukprot:XP_001452745.1 hypothetical protein (macronuclear) [Paramecium tetraurelia strain d4-2]
MGVTQTCIKEKHPTSQIEYSVPMIFRRKPQGKKPHKQNILIPPLQFLGESEETLEQLESTLQEPNINFSIHKTATFNSSANRQSLKIDQSLNHSLNTTTPNSVLQQMLNNSSFQESNKNKEEPIIHKKQQYKESQFKPNGETQNERRDRFARSLSNNSRAQRAQNLNDESSISQRKDSETNTKKKTNQLKRGISLKQQQMPINFDDTQSQKTSKSQKRVKFDPKIFRPKNTHFLQ